MTYSKLPLLCQPRFSQGHTHGQRNNALCNRIPGCMQEKVFRGIAVMRGAVETTRPHKDLRSVSLNWACAALLETAQGIGDSPVNMGDSGRSALP